MTGPITSSAVRRPGRPRHPEIQFDELWWALRRAAVWRVMFGWWAPWMKPGVAQLFLSKNWKHLEYRALVRFHEVGSQVMDHEARFVTRDPFASERYEY